MKRRGRRCVYRATKGPGWTRVLVLFALGAVLALGCRRPATGSSAASSAGFVVEVAALRGELLDDGIYVGAPRVLGNLTVFPVLARSQPELGKLTTLAAALERREAEVREVGAGSTAPTVPPDVAEAGISGGDATVGKLVIENRGSVPIYALAGTVVKGGRQDRQIGQDFLVAARSTIAVDAFCVEHGRWEEERGGVATKGQFSALTTLANAKVRAAGQYDENQGKVWEEVGKVNAANAKEAASGTLAATLDDDQVRAETAALMRRATQRLEAGEPAGAVVGFAYAIDGDIKGVRWFANHAIFELFRETLLNTAAVDAITARAGQPAQAPPIIHPADVREFVVALDQAKTQKTRETAGQNANDYAETARGYRSETRLKSLPAGAPAAKSTTVSRDYVKK